MILDYNKDKLNYNAEFLKRNFGLTSNDCQILSSVYDDIDAGNYNLEFSDLSPHITASEEEQARELSIAFIYKQQNTANFHDLQTAGIVTSLTEDIFTVGVLAV